MKDLLTRALEAHGGLSRWREIEAFQLKVSIGGANGSHSWRRVQTRTDIPEVKRFRARHARLRKGACTKRHLQHSGGGRASAASA